MSAPMFVGSRFFRLALARSVSTLALICSAGQACAAPAGEATDLPEITVSADRAKSQTDAQNPADGSAAAGYRVESAAMGPLGDKKILDTPYSIVSIPLDLMVSQQAANIQDVLKYDPSAQIEPRGNLDFGRPQTRGFENSSTQNTRIDGFNSYTIMAYPMEAFQTLEVLNGAAGALYGASSPGGTFNFVSKRPTDQPMAAATIGYDSNSLFTEHVEASGRTGDGGAFGYRINALHADGASYVAGSSVKRQLLTGNFDFHLSGSTKVELNAYNYVDNEKGFPSAFVYGANPNLPYARTLISYLPAPLDPTKAGYGVVGAGQTLNASTVDLKVIHAFTPDWKLTVGGLWQHSDRTENPTGTYGAADPGNWLTTSGQYAAIIGDTALRQDVHAMLANLNGKVEFFGVTHDLVLGTNGYEQPGQTRIGQNYLLGTSNLYNPTIYTIPDYVNGGSFYKSAYSGQQVIVTGDTITFNEHFQTLVALSQTWLTSQSFNPAGVRTADYDASALSPTLSLIYKPTSSITTYVTYADALQQGDTAPTTAGVTNSGQMLPPYRSKEYEIGAKIALPNNLEASAAAFRMSRPYAFLNSANNTFEVIGEQVNDGVEVLLRGRVFDSLNVIGGVTWLDPELCNTGNAATSDKLVVSVPRWQANLFAEYDIPALMGLSVNANLHYASARAANVQNTSWADAYATLDLGARYTAAVDGHKLTFRAGVSNVTDTRYWAAILPETVGGGSSQAGSATSVYAAFLGAPRVFHLSATVEF